MRVFWRPTQYIYILPVTLSYLSWAFLLHSATLERNKGIGGVFVCLPVCPLHGGNASILITIGSCGFYRLVAQGLFFLYLLYTLASRRTPLRGLQTRPEWAKTARKRRFPTIKSISETRYFVDRHIVTKKDKETQHSFLQKLCRSEYYHWQKDSPRSVDFGDVQIVHKFAVWVTSKLDFTVTILFNVKYLKNGTRQKQLLMTDSLNEW